MTTKDILTYHRTGGSRGRHTTSNQLAISARLDSDVANAIAEEERASATKRNAIINLAVAWYLRELDDARRLHCNNVYTEGGRAAYSHERLLTNGLTCQQLSKLHHICSSLNVSVDELVERLLDRLLESYDDRPMLYL